MAHVMRRQGTYLLKRGSWYLLTSLSCFLLIGIGALALHPLAGLVPLPLAVIALYRYASYQKGWVGEQEVIHALQALDDSYYVIHDARIPRANVDHLVLGPNGVFVLETKNISGQVTCEGDRWWVASLGSTSRGRPIRSPSRQVRRNAGRVRDRIRQFEKTLLRGFPQIRWVHAMVVLSDPHAELTLRAATVPVVRLSELVQQITSTPSLTVLPAAALTKIGLALLGMEGRAGQSTLHTTLPGGTTR